MPLRLLLEWPETIPYMYGDGTCVERPPLQRSLEYAALLSLAAAVCDDIIFQSVNETIINMTLGYTLTLLLHSNFKGIILIDCFWNSNKHMHSLLRTRQQ